ncbi:hypothetical protein EDC36_104217 [Tepidimonas ignava]|jgi:hypothetical protein|uniref:Uncharacterized protein n=1 Tax=Tepidimonas ignava TaxID=114249 RepID=A0A4R3LFD3_9BURK|nr:hypothetical protein [Tepidimonas ignava]TCS98793.1 hypothetical protein EDC36_104217 [Tepidimonas ignava]TSE20282.1 hypothetical protein Tigna_01913 [Tepidimonas ignava]
MNISTTNQTAATVGLDLLRALIDEMRLCPKPWAAMSQAQQDEVIERLRRRVLAQVHEAVKAIAADGRVVVAGELEQITIKDGVKAVIKMSQASPHIHELYSSAGSTVLVVVADAKPYTQGMDEVKGEPDQNALALPHEASRA